MTRFLGYCQLTLLATVLMVGCGSSGEPEAAEAPPQAGEGRNSETEPTVEDTADRCPPVLSTPAPAAGQAVDDIVGVRPGQSFDDVHARLGCREEGYTLEVASRWVIRDTGDLPTRQVLRATNGVACSGQEIARDMGSIAGNQRCIGGFSGSNFRAVRDATDEVYVGFTGMFGQEIAGAVWRSRSYPEDARPSVDKLEQALIDKYGEPSHREEMRLHNWGMRKGDISLNWVYDLRGRRVSAENPQYQQCLTISPAFSGTHRWSGSCGTVVRAGIAKYHGNDLLVDRFDIGVMDQKAFYEGGERFKAELAAALEQQRQDAAREAAAVMPDL
ncbi:hypothetical protein [Kineobactrum salinum]|uniref:Uncharacterized protein n=1 Tax=Kineobactrum salinum TaxID=2708301 RepID=A0A6C0U3N2_9GAMM|nr:hypothetical protein [Kineobactrum salinum]QIB66701.1 hypothetical protein G3T16_16165 [Kineobactrum salinum]